MVLSWRGTALNVDDKAQRAREDFWLSNQGVNMSSQAVLVIIGYVLCANFYLGLLAQSRQKPELYDGIT